MEDFNKSLYNSVSDAWQDIMGGNFHFGYFQTPDTPLDKATYALIDRMAGLADFGEDTKVLDVGCGIGTPAFYLYEKFKCSITGISTSDKGIEIANKSSNERGHAKKVKFQVADGTNNGFPANSFDIAWVQESSHLMDKQKLLKECYRILKPNGILILCDLMLKNDSPLKISMDIIKMISKMKYMATSPFGQLHVRSMRNYWTFLKENGFKEITTIDITDQVFPTINHWKTNIVNNKDKVLQSFSNKDVEEFIIACDNLDMIYSENIFGYGIIQAKKY